MVAKEGVQLHPRGGAQRDHMGHRSRWEGSSPHLSFLAGARVGVKGSPQGGPKVGREDKSEGTCFLTGIQTGGGGPKGSGPLLPCRASPPRVLLGKALLNAFIDKAILHIICVLQLKSPWREELHNPSIDLIPALLSKMFGFLGGIPSLLTTFVRHVQKRKVVVKGQEAMVLTGSFSMKGICNWVYESME